MTKVLLAVCCAAAGLLLGAGCAVDPIEKLEDELDKQEVHARVAAVHDLQDEKDERSIELLVETLESDPDLLEQAGNALVIKGREWERKHPNKKKTEQNPVTEAVGQSAKDMHLDAAVRAKACWILGEIGDRDALAVLGVKKDDPNSQRVRNEALLARAKLGFEAAAQRMEMLDEDRFIDKYRQGDPDATPAIPALKERFKIYGLEETAEKAAKAEAEASKQTEPGAQAQDSAEESKQSKSA